VVEPGPVDLGEIPIADRMDVDTAYDRTDEQILWNGF
jgi:hypothetical protein